MRLMKLIYKRKGSKNMLNNFRPITMLNTDMKILAKILPTIITTNQAYGVKGRDIADITRGIRDIISVLNERQENGYFINLDFEKTLDRVEHSFYLQFWSILDLGKMLKNGLKFYIKM